MTSHEITAACKISQVDALERDMQTHLLKGQDTDILPFFFFPTRQFYRDKFFLETEASLC